MPKPKSRTITAPDGLHFGDTFMPITTGDTTGLHAVCKVYANETSLAGDALNPATGVLYADEIHFGSQFQPGPFLLGPTPSWAGGGGDGELTLVDMKGRVYASDTFDVEG